MRLTDLLDKEHSFRYLVGFVLALLFLVRPATIRRRMAPEMVSTMIVPGFSFVSYLTI